MAAQKDTIVYLYSEVMPYTVAVMKAITKKSGVKIHCIKWDANKRSPFEALTEEDITFYDRSAFDEIKLTQFISELRPLLVVVSGRMEKLYLHGARYCREHKIPVVTGSDNQWNGSFKNRIASALGYFLYRRYFDYIWVAGARQYEFAKKIGYRDNSIINCLYSADTSKFEEAWTLFKDVKRIHYPHTITFVGRFIGIKGVANLVEAFLEAKKENENDWRLLLIGTGDQLPSIPPDSSIEVLGFMPNAELATASGDWGVFCLPSLREPWGVVVHEAAAAGLPLICSDAVGAADAFLEDGKNGYLFNAGDKDSLKAAISKITQCTDEELMAFGMRSNELSKTISPVKAADSLMSILKDPK